MLVIDEEEFVLIQSQFLNTVEIVNNSNSMKESAQTVHRSVSGRMQKRRWGNYFLYYDE